MRGGASVFGRAQPERSHTKARSHESCMGKAKLSTCCRRTAFCLSFVPSCFRCETRFRIDARRSVRVGRAQPERSHTKARSHESCMGKARLSTCCRRAAFCLSFVPSCFRVKPVYGSMRGGASILDERSRKGLTRRHEATKAAGERRGSQPAAGALPFAFPSCLRVNPFRPMRGGASVFGERSRKGLTRRHKATKAAWERRGSQPAAGGLPFAFPSCLSCFRVKPIHRSCALAQA